MADTNIIYPYKSTTLGDFKRGEPLLSIQDLKDRYLIGVDLKDDRGNLISDESYKFYIDAAITKIEHELEFFITPVELEEDHDYTVNDYMQWMVLELDYAPVIDVTDLQIRFIKDSSFTSFPKTWYRIDHYTGMLRLTATQGEIQNWIFTQFSLLPRLISRMYDFPHFFKVFYTAGFEQDKIPKIINHLVGLEAATSLLRIAGDLILGAGIASQSIGIDGLSQSVQSTASAMYSGYSARIEMYTKEIEQIRNIVKKYYCKDIRMGVI